MLRLTLEADRPQGMKAAEYGPLVFSLPIQAVYHRKECTKKALTATGSWSPSQNVGMPVPSSSTNRTRMWFSRSKATAHQPLIPNLSFLYNFASIALLPQGMKKMKNLYHSARVKKCTSSYARIGRSEWKRSASAVFPC